VNRVISIAVALLCLCDIAPAQNQQTWGSMIGRVIAHVTNVLALTITNPADGFDWVDMLAP
jgi:hypothetical protein